MNPRQQRAWSADRERYVLDVPRSATDTLGVAGTSVDPDFIFDAGAVFGRAAGLVMEIGSGQGEAVVAAAEREPGRDFLAVEVYLPGLAQTVLRAARLDLTNLRIAPADAARWLATAMPPDSVDELWVFFPDPWHKHRHHKRRLVSPSFAAHAARVLRAPSGDRPGGVLRLATDWSDYGTRMLQVLSAEPGLVNEHGPGGVAPRFAGRAMTGFERKAGAAGRAITELTFRRRA